MRTSRFLLFFVFVVCVAASALADSPPSLDALLRDSFRDNADLRLKYFTSLILAPKETVWAFGEKTVNTETGPVLIKTLRRSEDFFIQFVNGREGVFPEYSRGSYIIERSPAKGYLVQAKIFLQDDPSCYARLYPQGEGTRLDIIMYGAVLKKNLYVPGMLYTILSRPFSDVVAATRRSFDWEAAFGLGDAAASGNPTPTSPEGADDSGILALISGAPTVEDMLSSLGTAGEAAREFEGDLAILGLAEDRELVTTSLPYAAFPGYEAARGGLPPFALRAALYLDRLDNPGSRYLLAAGSLRAVAILDAESTGELRFSFRSQEGELDWSELASRLGSDRVRILRLTP